MEGQRTHASIAAVGEFGFLRALLPTFPAARGVPVGPGDDCAVVAAGRRRWLVTTDALVEGVHFRRAWMTPAQIGRKAYLVNASDIAAMGGAPRFCLLSVGVPADFPHRDLTAIHRGITAAAGATGAAVVGGNLARAAELFVSITLIGDAPARPVLRAGARPGDGLYVTGALGAAALGLRRLRADAHARGSFVHRFREPAPRLRAGALLARARVASAMIDISDGLLQDLGHLCAASNVGAELERDRLPCAAAVRRQGIDLALCGGEDYELLFAVRPRQRARLERLLPRLGCPVTRIGVARPPRDGLRIVDQRGGRLPLPVGGFDHFARAKRS